MKFSFLFAWYDLWVGFFYDKKKAWLYILPIPTVGIILKFPVRRYWLISKSTFDVIGSTTKSDLEYECKINRCGFKPYWSVNGSTKPLFGKDYNW